MIVRAQRKFRVLQKYVELIRLMGNEKKPLKKLRQEQNIKLQHLIRHAYENVPFYFKKFQEAKIHPDDIQTTDDLKKIPIISKDDFYAAEPIDLIDKRIKDRSKLITLKTSGSSGRVLQFFVNQHYNQLRKAQFLRPYISNGTGLFDRAIWFRANPEIKKPFYQKLGLLRDYQFYAGSDPELQIKLIQKIRPTIMRGYGSVFQLIASRVQEENINIHAPRIIFTDSELLRKESREKIEHVFKTKVIDVYGTFETENIAYECNQHEGYHMGIDCAIIEFIKNGKQVQAGKVGEVVFTVLDNYTSPFIRYNIGDLATYNDQPCSCGRSLPLMGMVTGRTYDYVLKRNGDKISSTTLLGHVLVNFSKYIHEYQFIQKDFDIFSMLIIPTRLYHDKIGKELTNRFRRDFPDARIKIQLVDKIKREDSGKLKAFKSLMKK
jgi:phenylacetate-CoA ligase